MKILQIDSSISGASSVTRQLTASIVDQLVRLTPGTDVQYIDVAANPLPQLSPGVWAAKMAGAGGDHAESGALAALSESVAAFVTADVVVLGAPMYNFSVPSQLKAWIDSICAAGVTFSYSAEGVKGLCGGKRVIIASARGNVFTAPSPNAAMDYQENYLRAVFRFLGIDAIEIVRAEGVAFGPEPRQLALDAAQAGIAALAA